VNERGITGAGSAPSVRPKGAQPEIMDWWSGETLALILLVAFVIAAIVLTRSG
jgi:hypothetical protein